MDKKLTRKQFLLFVGSFVGLFVVSRVSGLSPRTTAASYGSGTYGGTTRA